MEEKKRELGSRQSSCKPGEFRAVTDGNEKYIEGYFAVFGSNYDIGPGMSESIDPHAFDDAIDDDIRCLTDHDTRLVIGRTTAGTFELSIDGHGLYGRALVNPNDQDALNTHARVDRGDVSQASFGFDITDEESEVFEDGSVHWTIKGVKLYECSIVTFPAYAETNIEARTKDALDVKKRETESLKEKLKKKLKGEE